MKTLGVRTPDSWAGQQGQGQGGRGRGGAAAGAGAGQAGVRVGLEQVRARESNFLASGQRQALVGVRLGAGVGNGRKEAVSD